MSDPVVSPADTIRRHYTKVCRCEWHEGELTRWTSSENCVIHGSVPDPLDALLAVGERDRRKVEAYDAARAEVKIEGHSRAYYVLRAQDAEARRERDRQQIARLTEVLEHPRKLETAALELASSADDVAGHVMDNGLAPRLSLLRDRIFNVREMVEANRVKRRAVLAGEEDARPGQNVTEGMPPELVRALRDPTIRLPQDDYKLADGRSLWEHLQEWRNAPSNTASADEEDARG